MTPLYTTEDFKAAKYKDTLPLKCRYCNQTFYRTKAHIIRVNSPSSKANRITGDFCSRSCLQTSHGPPIQVPCNLCGKVFTKRPFQMKGKNNFCSSSCAAKYNNAHKTTGTRVSKLERWLQEQLPKRCPDLEFHFNRKDAIDGELDIYIPSLKLAFELNGIFHYEPIYGPEKLASIQSNDGRKFQACLERGIELCIVDVSQMMHFKEKRALKYLEVIQKVIINCQGGVN